MNVLIWPWLRFVCEKAAEAYLYSIAIVVFASCLADSRHLH